MNNQIQVPAFKINIIYLLAIALVFLLSWSTISQWQSNKDINQSNLELKKQNIDLQFEVKRNEAIIKDNEIITDRLANRVNELIKSDSIQKKQLQTIKWRYAKLKQDYNSASTSDKNKLFTDLINN